MKKKMYFLLLLAFVGLCAPAKAVLVNIPDANFRAKLQTLYPACFVGAQMETTCSGITSATFLDVQAVGITDLSGIGYFTSLTNLNCAANNQLTNLPSLPTGLQTLNCNLGALASLPALPTTLQTLICYQNRLTSLPTLPSGLSTLICYENQLDFADLELINPKPATYNVDRQLAIVSQNQRSFTTGSATATFNASIGGSLNVYQWYKFNINSSNRILIPGANSAIYTKSNISLADEGEYVCEIRSTFVGAGTTTNVAITGAGLNC